MIETYRLLEADNETIVFDVPEIRKYDFRFGLPIAEGIIHPEMEVCNSISAVRKSSSNTGHVLCLPMISQY